MCICICGMFVGRGKLHIFLLHTSESLSFKGFCSSSVGYVSRLNVPIKRHTVANLVKKKERENLYNRLISGKTHTLK